MVGDELVALENLPGTVGAEQMRAQARRKLVLSSMTQGRSLDLTPREIPGGWELDLPDDVIVGRLGTEAKTVTTSELADLATGELPPYLPEGSGVVYHPKSAQPRSRSVLRRRNGKRVRPHGYVIGDDDRRVFDPSGYPWHCTGKVYAWTDPSGGWAWAGSGALVGRNVVLTASHIVPWNNSPWMMQFVPASWDGSSLVGMSSFVEAYQGYGDHDQGDDMAVLKLYDPLGDTLGFFGYKTYSDDWEDGNYWTKVGYADGVDPARPSRIELFPVVDDDDDGAGVELEYHADSGDGESGGPVFGWWDDGPYVVGTHSGGEEEYEFPFGTLQNNVAAGGNALSALINWARTNW
jgi:V8-like Glu-specific endopeptidase